MKIGSFFQRISYRKTLKVVAVTATIGLLGPLASSMPAKSATFLYLSEKFNGDRAGNNYRFFFKNHSKRSIYYDFGPATGGEPGKIKGTLSPGQTEMREFLHEGSLEQLNVPLIKIANSPTPKFRFWSGGAKHDQYISLLQGDGYKVTKNTPGESVVTGNGLRISVDGGGVHDPNTRNIYVQVY